jgi:hypothetical protein
VSDETFAFFERMFLYDREPLNAVIEADAEDRRTPLSSCPPAPAR